ncbi:MAG: hypothetical protein ACO3AW_03555 [Chitinophagaceae bacterium]
MKKRILAYFLLTIISFQILPIKEVGKIFYGNQMIEEICQDIDADDKSSEVNEDFKKNDLFISKHAHLFLSFHIARLSSISNDVNYSSRLSDDTPTRPPLV